MTYARLLMAVALPVLGAGCGPSRPAPIELAPSAYAKQVKESVLSFVQSGKESPKAVAGRAEVFLENLQGYARRPLDENKPIYEELVQKCKEVAEVAKRSGDVKKKLDELATIANKLPG